MHNTKQVLLPSSFTSRFSFYARTKEVLSVVLLDKMPRVHGPACTRFTSIFMLLPNQMRPRLPAADALPTSHTSRTLFIRPSVACKSTVGLRIGATSVFRAKRTRASGIHGLGCSTKASSKNGRREYNTKIRHARFNETNLVVNAITFFYKFGQTLRNQT